MKKLILVVALFGVVTATPLRIAGAQPASGSGAKPADDKDKPATGEDDTLYSCKKKTGNATADAIRKQQQIAEALRRLLTK